MTIHTNVLIASPFVLVVARVPAEVMERQVEVGERDVGIHARLVADMAELHGGLFSDQFADVGKMVQLSVVKNWPSFAVALNCGMASSSLSAVVKALVRLQMVRGWNSGYWGSK